MVCLRHLKKKEVNGSFFKGFRFGDEKQQVHVIQWAGYCDDYFHIKYEKDKPTTKFMLKRSNEHVNLKT
jgi:hypothetical protein